MRKKQKEVVATYCAPLVSEERLRSFLKTISGELHEIHETRNDSRLFTQPQSAALNRLLDRAPKRCRLGDEKALDRAAKEAFLRTNEECGHKRVNLPDHIVADARDFIAHALQLHTGKKYGTTGSRFPLQLLIDGWRFGPGASRSMPFITHFVDKIYHDKPSVTARALPYAQLVQKCNKHMGRQVLVSPTNYKKVAGSSLGTVEKNEDTRRTTCTEPLWNMGLQLSVGDAISEALKCVGLDISKQQEVNNLLALVGSVTGSVCTLDLKSASDMILIALIELLWPETWFIVMDDIRSETTLVDGSQIKLNMMSTMGNGFTFPMMTLTILALVYAVQSDFGSKRRHWIDYSTTSVYGDDIVVPTEQYAAVCTVLSGAGFVINHDKSYSNGLFRESCGGDYYMGVDITPFYVEELSSDPEVYIAINKLLEWVGRTEVLLPKTLAYLISLLHTPSSPNFVPVWEDANSGIRRNTVPRKYKTWKRKARFRLMDDLLPVLRPRVHTLCVLGGYLECRPIYTGPEILYSDVSSQQQFSYREVSYLSDCYEPRAPTGSKPKFVLKSARLPQGWRDGSFPLWRDEETSRIIDSFLDLAMEAC